MPKKFIIDKETNEFRESEEVEEWDKFETVEEREVEFMSGSRGDIEAVYAYREGDEARIGIVHEGKVLVQANISRNNVIGLMGLLAKIHNAWMTEHK